MLPMLLRIRIRNEETSFGFFLPLILLYIILLPVMLICAIVYGFMLLAPQQTKEVRGYMIFVLKAPQLITAARGTEILVHSNDSDVKMYIK